MFRCYFHDISQAFWYFMFNDGIIYNSMSTISNHRYFTQLQLFYLHIDYVFYLYVVRKMPDGLTDDIASLMRSLRSAQPWIGVVTLERLHSKHHASCKLSMIDHKAFLVTLYMWIQKWPFPLYRFYHSLYITHFLKKTLQNRFRQITVSTYHTIKSSVFFKNFVKIIFLFGKIIFAS